MEPGPAGPRAARGGGAIQRVCIVGGGVIGSLYAAHLARVAQVSVLCRREEHAEALRRHGLHVSGRHEFIAEVDAATDPAELPNADLAIVATKTTELDEAAARLAGRWPGAAVMT
ncbi:MAG TPA: 2-dehydropantoate 2-reductase N-terminal domain-containing protein, partial [Gaiellaceae bacterium]|nr:2-dehydropantoate 2-reductase N-terminal domain-containing protein [Gaiellaceae bacterium]